MVSLPIDFVSHPKIPVSLRSETSETGGSVSLFREKKFRYVSLQFCFEAKFGDTLERTLRAEMAGNRDRGGAEEVFSFKVLFTITIEKLR